MSVRPPVTVIACVMQTALPGTKYLVSHPGHAPFPYQWRAASCLLLLLRKLVLLRYTRFTAHACLLQGDTSNAHPHAIERVVGIRGIEEVELHVVGLIGQDTFLELHTCEHGLHTLHGTESMWRPSCSNDMRLNAPHRRRRIVKRWLSVSHRSLPRTVLFCRRWPECREGA